MAISGYNLVSAVPFATTESMGQWDNLDQATKDFNRVIAVIHAEHPCDDEYDVTNAVHLGHEAFEHFCEQMGDAENTIAFVRSRI